MRFIYIPLVQIVTRHTINYPTPININYYWSFGSLAGLYLTIQLLSGIILAMYYTPSSIYAFVSIEYIMRNVNGGWFFRYVHANGASFIFIFLYIHILRGLYFKSYFSPRSHLWLTGVILFLLMMATAFMGYVLPWGQMSFWGATVITNLFSAIPFIGFPIVQWLWGGFAVDNATLVRFFSLHYLLPFIIVTVVILHLYFLHSSGSTTPFNATILTDKVNFLPYFYVKDFTGFGISLVFFFIVVFFYPDMLGHPDNYIPANPILTPSHIVPEWYFLPFYAIIRSVPNKIGGVVCMFGAIFVLILINYFASIIVILRPQVSILSTINLVYIVAFYFYTANSLILGWLGAQAIEYPFSFISIISTLLYFILLLGFPLASVVLIKYHCIIKIRKQRNLRFRFCNHNKKKQELILCDIPESWQFGFQDPATPIMEGIVEFHNDLMFVLLIIFIFILYFLIRIIYLFSATSTDVKNVRLISKSHDTILETIWTVIPTFILFLIVTPSFALLYAMDEISDPEITVQVSGHQWYWHYDLSPMPQCVSEESFRDGNFDYSGHKKEDIVEVASELSELANDMYTISIDYDYDSYMILEEDLLLTQTQQTPFIVQTGHNRTDVNPYGIFNDYDFAYEAYIYFIARHYMIIRGDGGYNLNMCLVGEDCESITKLSLKNTKYASCKPGRTHYVDLPNIHSAITRCDKIALSKCGLINQWNADEEAEIIKWLTPKAYLLYEYSRAYPDYCKSDAGLSVIPFRLLTTDTHLHLPTNTHIRLLVTSGDVLHSWAVPSLGVKVDACPGRLNMTNIYIKRPGTYYGQCSEICGILHSYMPITLTATDNGGDSSYLNDTFRRLYWSSDFVWFYQTKEEKGLILSDPQVAIERKRAAAEAEASSRLKWRFANIGLRIAFGSFLIYMTGGPSRAERDASLKQARETVERGNQPADNIDPTDLWALF